MASYFGNDRSDNLANYTYSLIFGPGVIRTFGEARGPVTGTSPKLGDLVHSYQFSMLLLTDFGSWGDPNFQGSPGSAYGDLAKTRRFCPFLPVFCDIIQCFLVFVVVRTFGKARGPVTGTPPKLEDFVRFSQFSVLLLTDFGSRGDPIVRGTPGSAYGDLTKNRRFAPFLPVFCAIIQCFLVVVVVRTFGEARGPVTGTSPKLHDFVRFGQFCTLLLTVFWVSVGSKRSVNPGDRLRGPRQNSQIWSILTSFLCYYSLFFGCRGRPNVRGSPGSGFEDLTKTRRFGPFLPVFYAITH
jgi:hypothetical protein